MSADATSFLCRVCGKTHDGLPDLAFDLPFVVAEIAPGERAARCVVSDDLCVLDGVHYFVRGVVEIPVHGLGRRFGFGAWSTLSADNFRRYRETFDSGSQGSLGAMFGWFSNRIPHFPDTLNLKCAVRPRDGRLRPALEIADAAHPLAIAQRDGATLERVHEFLGWAQ